MKVWLKRYGFIYVDRDEFDLKNIRSFIKKIHSIGIKKVIASNGEDLN